MIYQKRFENKNVIVTGGESGIGKSIATRIRMEGGRVITWDKIARANLSKYKEDSVEIDITNWKQVKLAASRSVRKLGKVDALVCSAGITGPNAKTWDYPIEEWDRVFDVNINGTFYCNKALIPSMIKKNYGRIVNIASIAGKEGNPNASAYSASKAAVIALTKSLGKELAKYPIMVNCVTPAAVKTSIFDQMSDEHIEFMLSKIPLGRFGTIEEVASLVLWLISDECSFSTGAVFDVSGGRATY